MLLEIKVVKGCQDVRDVDPEFKWWEGEKEFCQFSNSRSSHETL